jgi:hypothetical protein
MIQTHFLTDHVVQVWQNYVLMIGRLNSQESVNCHILFSEASQTLSWYARIRLLSLENQMKIDLTRAKFTLADKALNVTKTRHAHTNNERGTHSTKLIDLLRQMERTSRDSNVTSRPITLPHR